MVRKVSLDDWVEDVKARTRTIKNTDIRRPKRPIRTVNSRTPEESDALAYAVMLAWDNALESGILRKDGDRRYTICIPKKKS